MDNMLTYPPSHPLEQSLKDYQVNIKQSDTGPYTVTTSMPICIQIGSDVNQFSVRDLEKREEKLPNSGKMSATH